MSIEDVAATRDVLAALAIAARARGAMDEVELLARAAARLERDIAERSAVAGRKRRSRGCPADVTPALSLSVDLKDPERETEGGDPGGDVPPIDPRQMALPYEAPRPSEPQPSPIRPDDLLTIARQLVAERAGVADPDTCWRKFAAYKAGQRIDVDRAWSVWCLNERNRAPPPTVARAPPAPASETRITIAARQRARDLADAEYRRAAMPAPPNLAGLLNRLANGGPGRQHERTITQQRTANGASA